MFKSIVIKLVFLCNFILFSTSNNAATFKLFDDSVDGRINSSINYGISFRVGGPDDDVISLTNGGDQNFGSGDVIVNRITGIHELSLEKDNLGAFFRATYFYDQANEKDLGIRTPGGVPIVDRSKAAKDSVSDINLLDAFVYGSFTLADRELNARFGEQIISWGESTFIAGGINEINTVDVNQLRTAGSELKTALLPNLGVSFNYGLSDNASLEAFYLFDFDEVKLDAAGTFFNTATFIGDGGLSLGPLLRVGSHYAKNSGQYGAALRFLVPTLGSGHEIGLYFMNIHSHAPFLSTNIGKRNFFLEYPEDIKIYGISSATNIGDWAVGGEVSYRTNMPLNVGTAFLVPAGLGAPTPLPKSDGVARTWDRGKTVQAQLTGQVTFIPRTFFHADDGSFLGEFGYHRVVDKPALYGGDTSAIGYQMTASMTYNTVLFDLISLIPKMSFRHDMRGTAGPFTENQKSITVALDWSYQIKWTGGISYTTNFSGPNSLGSKDRNWLAMNIKLEY